MAVPLLAADHTTFVTFVDESLPPLVETPTNSDPYSLESLRLRWKLHCATAAAQSHAPTLPPAAAPSGEMVKLGVGCAHVCLCDTTLLVPGLVGVRDRFI